MTLEETLNQITRKIQSEIPMTRYIATRHLTGIIAQQPEQIQQLYQEQPHIITKLATLLGEENSNSQILSEEAQRALRELQKIIPLTLTTENKTKPEPLQRCPRCNTENKDGWKYCPNCGTHLNQEEATATCLNCHQPIKPLQTCPNCGTHL